MRPARFQTLLHQLLDQDPQVKTVQPATATGIDRYPYALAVTYPTGARTLLQILGTSADGDRYNQTEQIIEGDRAPAEVPVPEVFDQGTLRLDRVDQHLTAVILNSGSREIVSAQPFSGREQAGAIPYGVKVVFHDGARIYLNVVHAVPAGRDTWPHRAFDVPATI